MKSFSSSVINKSGKKFAPKAPARRAAPAPSAPRAPSRRPSVASQASASHPPATTSETATPEPPLPPPPPSTVEPLAPSESTVAGSSFVAPTVEPAPIDQLATAIPIPRPKPKESVAVPIPQPKPKESIAVPIPRPKPKESVAVPIPRPTKDALTASQSSPPLSATATTEPAAQAPERHDGTGEGTRTIPDVLHNEKVSATLTVADHDEEVAPEEVRPPKRQKTTIESAPTTALGQELEDVAQLVTPPATQTPALGERVRSRNESEAPSTTRQSGDTSKAGSRRASRSTSNDAGKIQKKERKRRTRKREPTPDGAELIEIAPSVIKMSDLCKDTRTGKRSKREIELRAHELAEAERNKAQQEEDRQVGMPVKQTKDTSPTEEESTSSPNKKSQAGPVMRIVNGEIVLDHASLQVDRHADAERNGDDLEDVVENSLTRKINQATYGKRSKTESWDEDMTDLFYRGLRMFGTDFMVISKLFPGRSRRQIKLKFNNEERRDPQRIKETLLGPRETIDINTYSEMTNTVYDDPRIIQQELDEEKRVIEEQYERDKKAQEDLLRNPEGLAGSDAPGADKATTKGKRNNKKQSARDAGGGTEEILGSIDD
ncbi:hypothetical protein BJX76DRAFT_337695 [Aspergillus varians]